MSATNLEILTFAFNKVNIIDETQAPSAEQGTLGLTLLNDLMADWAADGVDLGWYPQTDPSGNAPLQDGDVRGVKYGLTGELAAHFGIQLDAETQANIDSSYTKLVKRTRPYSEANMSELPRAQGSNPGHR